MSRTLTILNPATEAPIREISCDAPESVRAKVAAARDAQPAWASRSLADRIAIVRRFGEALARDRDGLAALTTAEMGKPLRQARNEIDGVAGRLAFFAESVAAEMADRMVWCDPPDRLREVIRFEPLGVVAHISPWNYPYFVAANVYLPALLTGSAVVYKPSEHATLTGLAVTERLHEAGVPQAVFAAVVGPGDVGAAVVESPVDALFFTGSAATGRQVAAAAAPRLIPVQLELGGKDPVYVCDDASWEKAAVSLADGAFYNTGQSCCSVERLYVHEAIHDVFVQRFVAEVKGFVVGDPTDEGTYLGPLARKAQLAVLEAQVADAVARGATLHCGGRARAGRGYYFEPTVLTHVDHTMLVQREESFGPIIGIQKVKSDDEAVALMNDSPYGLTAGVYTPDRARAERLLSRVDSGSVYWNCCDRVSPRLPWSGRRTSGLGTTLSYLGIRAFLRPKAWHYRG